MTRSKKNDALLIPCSVLTSVEEADQIWGALGVTYANRTLGLFVDPERALIFSLPIMAKDLKLLRIVMAWLKDFHYLVHVERISTLIATYRPFIQTDWEIVWRIMAGLSTTIAADGDRRWKKVVADCTHLCAKTPQQKIFVGEPYLSERHGCEEAFAKFDLCVPLPGEGATSTRKLLTRRAVLNINPWLKLRALFGTNWRADVICIMMSQAVENPYQAAKMLGCSYETAWRIWQSCDEADMEKIIQRSLLFAKQAG